jgi:hypothetical protein
MVKKIVKKITTETIDEDGNKKTVVKEHASKVTDGSKKVHHKVKSSESKEKKMTAREREELLIENFVGLQHAMTNMSIKFGSLSDNMSKLLQVFEEAAKGFVVGSKGDDKDMLVKLDSLLDQNKTIAKGLVLMEEKVKTRVEHSKDVEKITGEARHSRPEVKRASAIRPSPEGIRAAPFPTRPKPLPRI